MKHEVITLCGSTRFQKEFERMERDFTLAGMVVFSCGVFSKGRDADVFDNADATTVAAKKRILNNVHADKIAMSSSIFVVNPNGYIGNSTWREITLAAMAGKDIYSLEEISGEAIFEHVNSAMERAEQFASWQLNAIARNPLELDGAEVSFRHKGVRVLDPWVRESQQGEPLAWERHRKSEFDPAKYYGRNKFARFVFDAMVVLSE